VYASSAFNKELLLLNMFVDEFRLVIDLFLLFVVSLKYFDSH